MPEKCCLVLGKGSYRRQRHFAPPLPSCLDCCALCAAYYVLLRLHALIVSLGGEIDTNCPSCHRHQAPASPKLVSPKKVRITKMRRHQKRRCAEWSEMPAGRLETLVFCHLRSRCSARTRAHRTEHTHGTHTQNTHMEHYSVRTGSH